MPSKASHFNVLRGVRCLSMELWAQLCQLIFYQSGGPPDLPLAVMVRFDNYAGPTYVRNTTYTLVYWCP